MHPDPVRSPHPVRLLPLAAAVLVSCAPLALAADPWSGDGRELSHGPSYAHVRGHGPYLPLANLDRQIADLRTRRDRLQATSGAIEEVERLDRRIGALESSRAKLHGIRERHGSDPAPRNFARRGDEESHGLLGAPGRGRAFGRGRGPSSRQGPWSREGPWNRQGSWSRQGPRPGQGHGRGRSMGRGGPSRGWGPGGSRSGRHRGGDPGWRGGAGRGGSPGRMGGRGPSMGGGRHGGHAGHDSWSGRGRRGY